MRSLSDIDVVVLTYKGDHLLRDCLDSLRRTCGDEPHVIVVDNSPSPATRELVAGYANTFYLESSGDPGFAGGNNRALPHCTRPYVLLLNNDTVVHDRFHSYYEETDFCHRVWLGGGEVWYVPTPPIDHVTSATFSKVPRPQVLRRYYRNILFSLNTCLGAWSRFWIVPRVKALVFAQALRNRLRGNKDAADAGFGALRDARAARADVRAVRRRVQAARRVSDRELFRIVRRRMPLSYFLRSARS